VLSVLQRGSALKGYFRYQLALRLCEVVAPKAGIKSTGPIAAQVNPGVEVRCILSWKPEAVRENVLRAEHVYGGIAT